MAAVDQFGMATDSISQPHRLAGWSDHTHIPGAEDSSHTLGKWKCPKLASGNYHLHLQPPGLFQL